MGHEHARMRDLDAQFEAHPLFGDNKALKKRFEEWFVNRYKDVEKMPMSVNVFYTLEFSLQWGVWLEFFGGVGIYPFCDPVTLSIGESEGIRFKWWVSNITELLAEDNSPLGFLKRTEAQQAAIKKAIEICPA